MSLPSPGLLIHIQQHILNRPNKLGENKKETHYCLFLLGSKSGLRISEALNFDLANKNKQGLYKITPTKKQKERYAYISPQVISELKKQNWKSNQTNRFNFYHFLKKIKKELGISKEIELTPHTLRRAFATYYAEAGLPLPLLQKLLGHKSIRTTALYWMNIYSEPEQSIKPPQDDIADILLGKEWLEKHENKEPNRPQPALETMPDLITEPSIKSPENIQENFAEFSPLEPESNQAEISPLVLVNKPRAEKELLQTEPIEPKPLEKPTQILVESEQAKISEPLPLTNEPNQEQVLLNKVQQLEEQLKKVQAENKSLKAEKVRAEASTQQASERADYYESQLKSIVKSLYQWQKINYYQQLEQARQKCQIIQIEKPLLFRSGK